ncbi:hypothetical protein [Thermosphaera chiliense]|nr:hypothetical protein [Thermosphaera aggregans]
MTSCFQFLHLKLSRKTGEFPALDKAKVPGGPVEGFPVNPPVS